MTTTVRFELLKFTVHELPDTVSHPLKLGRAPHAVAIEPNGERSAFAADCNVLLIGPDLSQPTR